MKPCTPCSIIRDGASPGRVFFAAALCLLGALPCFAANPKPSAAPPQEITVTLFGQPCQLSGPFEKATLKEIHSISPEQMYPVELNAANLATMRNSIEKLKNARSIPPGLDRYRERLQRRLEAGVAFLEALSTAKKTKKSEPLFEVVTKFAQGKRTKEFNAQVKKIDLTGDSDSASQVLDSMLELVEPDPEEEFHKATQRLSVQYTCVFSDEVSGTDTGEAPQPSEPGHSANP